MRVCPATKENQEFIRFLEASFNTRPFLGRAFLLSGERDILFA